jgi:hypothetical protein
LKPYVSWIRTLLLLALAGSIVVGCAGVNEQSVAGNDDAIVEAGEETASAVKPSKGKEPKKEPKKEQDIAVSDQSNPSDKAVKDKKEPAKAPSYNVTEPFDFQKPTLMGFTIHDPLDAVVARFGQPQAESQMADGPRVIQVLEYPGFLFGAADKSILFIEVTSDQVNPGLNQFRIGQTVEEAQKALGPADSLNDFVMIYDLDHMILKCDLDPSTRQVISIKLFAE